MVSYEIPIRKIWSRGLSCDRVEPPLHWPIPVDSCVPCYHIFVGVLLICWLSPIIYNLVPWLYVCVGTYKHLSTLYHPPPNPGTCSCIARSSQIGMTTSASFLARTFLPYRPCITNERIFSVETRTEVSSATVGMASLASHRMATQCLSCALQALHTYQIFIIITLFLGWEPEQKLTLSTL